MTEDFSKHPVSLTEARADREGDMTKWTPRDVLIALLRQIDSGEVDVKTLIICYRHANEEGDWFTSNLKSAPDMINALGVIEAAKAKILADWMGK